MLLSEQFLHAFEGHRKSLLQLLDAVSEEQFSFKPWDDAMSFGKLFHHTLTSTRTFWGSVHKGEFERATLPEVQTLEDLHKLALQVTTEDQQLITGLSDEFLNQSIITPFSPNPIVKYQLLLMSRDHEIHHKGQLFVYARMMGAKELPFFVAR
nr:DinB family protein [Bacilli bacterium]